MADVEFYDVLPKERRLLYKFNITRKFVISYIGTFGFANGLEYILECARACENADLSVQFLLCGDGAMLDGLKKGAARLGLENLSFVEFQNREGVRDVMNISDAVFVSYKHVQILETGSPNKYFDGLASGKLILLNFGGWIKEEVETNQCGIFLDPRHPTDIVKKIIPFLNDVELLRQYQCNARLLAETNYSRKILGDKYVELITQSVNAG